MEINKAINVETACPAVHQMLGWSRWKEDQS